MDDGISVWRREPYRVFFPLGVVLSWAGVLPWLLFALGWSDRYPNAFHSVAQIQGFLTSFAVGFLFTAIPRRTGTSPPAAWQMVLGLLFPVATTVSAWCGWSALAQVTWLCAVFLVVGFAVARFRSRTATRRPPNSFVWVPISLLSGSVGAVMTLLSEPLDLPPECAALGRLMVLQGVFLGLVVGIGGMILPLITCGDAPPDAAPTDLRVRALNVAAALLLLATFVAEAMGHDRAALGARGAIILAVLLVQSRIWRRPRRPGLHRRLVWFSAWAIPLGYFVAVALHPVVLPGLHVVFIAGFALMALSVGLHVTFAHGGRPDLVIASPWPVAAVGACVLLAAVLRLLLELDPEHTLLWLGSASAVFLVGTLFWIGVAVGPGFAGPRPPSTSG